MNERHSAIPKGFLDLPVGTRQEVFRDLLSLGSFSIRSPEDLGDFAKQPHDDGGRGISIYFRAAMYQINFFSAEDPSQLHYSISREVLQSLGGQELESDERARDFLARELVRECKAFAVKIIPSDFLQERNEDRSLFIITQGDEHAKHLACEIDGKLWLDAVFLKHIGRLGKTGKMRAESISSASKNWMNDFKDNKKASSLFRIWVDTTKPPYNCRFPKILAEVLWKERVEKRFERAKKNVPAISTGTWINTIKPIVSKTSKARQTENKIEIIEDTGRVLAYAQTPFLDQKTLALITKGVNSLRSLAGHRLFRWQIRNGCQNVADNVADPRTILVHGGYETVANLIGCGKSPARISEVKSILYAQANMNFRLPNGDKVSALIMLREIDHHRNGEPNKLKIILGDLLLPSFVFSLPKNEQRLLIPIADLPPLVGSKNTHAAQAMLQLLVLEEFSRQSKEFYQSGSIRISAHHLEALCKEARLPFSQAPKVLEAWRSADINGKSFLLINGEDYSLSKDQIEVSQFLREQGKIRIQGASAGKQSSQKKRKLLAGTRRSNT